MGRPGVRNFFNRVTEIARIGGDRVSKKYCSICGCIMDQSHDGDICEVCLDELYESDPGEEAT